jgi:hypothetical protein
LLKEQQMSKPKNQRQPTTSDRARRAAENIDLIADAAVGGQPAALRLEAPLQLVEVIDHDMLYVAEWVERRRGAGRAALLRARTAEILGAIQKSAYAPSSDAPTFDLFSKARQLAYNLRGWAHDIEAEADLHTTASVAASGGSKPTQPSSDPDDGPRAPLVVPAMADSPEAGALPATQGGDAPAGRNSLRRKGASWEIIFGSEGGSFPVNDYKAIATLAKLLPKPNHQHALTDLVDADTRRLLEIPQAQDVTMDNPAIANLKRQYDELQQSPVPENPLEEQEHHEQVARLAEALKKVVGPGGRRRNLGRSNRDRAWEALTQDLRRLWPRLEGAGMPRLAAHLKAAILPDKPHITYQLPADAVPWDVRE